MAAFKGVVFFGGKIDAFPKSHFIEDKKYENKIRSKVKQTFCEIYSPTGCSGDGNNYLIEKDTKISTEELRDIVEYSIPDIDEDSVKKMKILAAHLKLSIKHFGWWFVEDETDT